MSKRNGSSKLGNRITIPANKFGDEIRVGDVVAIVGQQQGGTVEDIADGVLIYRMPSGITDQARVASAYLVARPIEPESDTRRSVTKRPPLEAHRDREDRVELNWKWRQTRIDRGAKLVVRVLSAIATQLAESDEQMIREWARDAHDLAFAVASNAVASLTCADPVFIDRDVVNRWWVFQSIGGDIHAALREEMNPIDVVYAEPGASAVYTADSVDAEGNPIRVGDSIRCEPGDIDDCGAVFGVFENQIVYRNRDGVFNAIEAKDCVLVARKSNEGDRRQVPPATKDAAKAKPAA